MKRDVWQVPLVGTGAKGSTGGVLDTAKGWVGGGGGWWGVRSSGSYVYVLKRLATSGSSFTFAPAGQLRRTAEDEPPGRWRQQPRLQLQGQRQVQRCCCYLQAQTMQWPLVPR